MTTGVDAAARLLHLSPAQLHTVHALSEARVWHGVGAVALAVLATLVVARAGWIAEIRARLERKKPRPWLVSLFAALLVGGVLTLTLGVWSGVAAWRIARLAGVHHGGLLSEIAVGVQSQGPWFPTILISAVILYALMRWLPRLWWLIPGVLAVGVSAILIWAPDQATQGLTPEVPPSAVRTAVMDLVHSAHVPAGTVHLSTYRGYDAEVTGDGAQARVAVTPDLLTASPAEARAAVGHVMGHHAHNDMGTFALLLSGLAIAGFLVAQLLGRGVARFMGGRDVASISAPETMPALMLIAVLWFALSTVAVNSFIRAINVGADQYSLDMAREPEGLTRWLAHDWRGADPAPSAVVEFLSYNHPSLASRLKHIQVWKAAQTRTPPTP